MASLLDGKRIVLSALLAFSSVACGSIRVVSITPSGGEVALQGDQDKARDKAEDYMANRCGPQGYDILSEQEAVVGQVATSSGPTYGVGGRRSGIAFSTMQTSTNDKHEWRITYQCRGAGPAVPAVSGSPPPAGPPVSGRGEIEQIVVTF
ncbi:MAG: hypothetical protein EOO75_02380 [Myxococcales bacterium]|nr:MAG: hypothetical protein EOO75_02380 [Myxococcales bacterium]